LPAKWAQAIVTRTQALRWRVDEKKLQAAMVATPASIGGTERTAPLFIAARGKSTWGDDARFVLQMRGHDLPSENRAEPPTVAAAGVPSFGGFNFAAEPEQSLASNSASNPLTENAVAEGSDDKADWLPTPPQVPWTKVRGEGYNATGPFMVHGRLALDGTGRLELKFAYTSGATFRRDSATKQESVVSAHLLLGPASEGYQGAEYGWPIVELPPLPPKVHDFATVAEAKSASPSANSRGEYFMQPLQVKNM
jgi:hypothetical protein